MTATFAIASAEGRILKVIPLPEGSLEERIVFGFHRVFGWSTEKSLNLKRQAIKTSGAPCSEATTEDWIASFELSTRDWIVRALENARVTSIQQGIWSLVTPRGNFQVLALIDNADLRFSPALTLNYEPETKTEKAAWIVAFLFFVLFLGLTAFIPTTEPPAQLETLEPVTVNLKPEHQKPVAVPLPSGLEKILEKQAKESEVRKAIQQDLGFLGLLGRKDLNKALGGAPTELKDTSPGAGAGGKEGSGGELLMGLGAGVKRTTVGNSGAVGLGGIGTKGRGGGQGGYGNASVGSGNGSKLSTMPVSQDIVLEGGLDRSVIQATIAKYLSQVRACYEQGLSRKPGLNGQVTMAFEISKEGAMNFARVARSSLGDGEVEQCISTRMMGWKFPKPLGGVAVKVSYPFLLRPVGT